jgi:hypothetical protein
MEWQNPANNTSSSEKKIRVIKSNGHVIGDSSWIQKTFSLIRTVTLTESGLEKYSYHANVSTCY